MKSRIVATGEGRSVVIPDPMLQISGLNGEVDLRAEPGRIVIGRSDHPRAGWSGQFAQMAAQGDDVMLWAQDSGSTSWDDDEWEW